MMKEARARSTWPKPSMLVGFFLGVGFYAAMAQLLGLPWRQSLIYFGGFCVFYLPIVSYVSWREGSGRPVALPKSLSSKAPAFAFWSIGVVVVIPAFGVAFSSIGEAVVVPALGPLLASWVSPERTRTLVGVFFLLLGLTFGALLCWSAWRRLPRCGAA